MDIGRAVFWSSLAAGFGALAAWVAWERRRVAQDVHALAGMPHVMLSSPTARVFRTILLVECAGFLLAMIAALSEVFG